MFKGFVGKGKDITTINFTDKGTVAVFEGPFDFLSLALHARARRARLRRHHPARGVAQAPRPRRPSPSTASAACSLFLDHDQAGRETTAFFKAQLGNRNVVDRSADYAGFKDLNEWRVRPSRNRSGETETTPSDDD